MLRYWEASSLKCHCLYEEIYSVIYYLIPFIRFFISSLELFGLQIKKWHMEWLASSPNQNVVFQLVHS